ncbi:TonB-dependent receptor plug domain-containing protein [Puniceicoccaceae bacterium K14]|nr:TonB-dependent receptor plug domain-containing protein [Puniceicoccaceae bacterium K14]
MNTLLTHVPWKSAFCVAVASSISLGVVQGQDEDPESEVYELSPFEVDTSGDSGYRATNTISGSRLNTKLKDIPMPIEVITEEFIDDIGATDLRESLRYSSGILTSSQNDAGSNNSTVGAGGVHNAEGTTANKTNTSYKVRGFITEATLRDGYRRQVTSDAVNVGRIEVIRGPSALLYGIGNFGGIVNYIPKKPGDSAKNVASVSMGNNGHRRGTYEGHMPLGTPWDFKFLFTAAYEENESYTELAKDDHLFFSPVLTFKPTEKTDVTIDFEEGDYNSSGNGYNSLRVNSSLSLENAADQQDRLENSGFLVFPGVAELRTMRLSGNDTYLDTDFDNIRTQVTHSFSENLNILIGYNEANVEYDQYDMGGSIAQVDIEQPDGFAFETYVMTAEGDIALAADDDGTPLVMIGRGTESYTNEKLDRAQWRGELNYSFDTFPNSDSLKMTHSILLGQSREKFNRHEYKEELDDGEFNYFDPSQYIYRVRGQNSDGSTGFLPSPASRVVSEARNTGSYFVYQGKFFNDRITAIIGRRKDENEVYSSTSDLRTTDPANIVDAPEQSKYTSQFGLSFEIIPQLTIFALQSEGITPNFDGDLDAVGNPIDAATAESREIGIKFELMEGKLSGTISAYEIEQIGRPTSYWWAPAPGKNQFDRDADIIYNVGNFNPGNNGGNGAAAASQAEWDAAVASGAAFEAIADAATDATWYVNASTGEGAAYLNSVFYKTRGVEEGPDGELVNVDYGDEGNPYGGWPGWLYTQDSITNNATMDWGSEDGNTYTAHYPTNEESKGVELNLQYQPTDNWQIVFNYAKTEREVTKVADFPRYPWAEGNVDNWAVWYFPDGNWGLRGAFGPNEAYSDPEDTSTWQAVGLLQGEPQDDTPEHELSAWTTYAFDEGALDGLILGLGAWWQDEREFESGITDGSGQIATDPDTGLPFNRVHDPRYEVNLMAKYSFKVSDRPAYVQLNLDNVLDDKDRYGWVYAPGISWKLQYGMEF